MNRFRLLVPLLALALATSASPVAAQSDDDSRNMGDIMADALEDLAREIGSAQDDISDLAEGIDPSDPDTNPDPGPQLDPDDPAEPTGTEPDGPAGTEPGEPAGTETDESGGGDEPGDEIELPEPSEPEEGGFAEIQLLPDPVPLAGGWHVINHPGKMTCTGAGTIQLKKSDQQTRIAVLQDGRVLSGQGLVPDQPKTKNRKKKNRKKNKKGEQIKLTWQPETEAYTGVVKVAAPGGQTRITFYLRVVSPKEMKGEMVATTTVNAQGVKGRCGGTRRITLTHK